MPKLLAGCLFDLFLADVQVAVAQGAGDHDAVGAGRLGGGEDLAGELEDDAGARQGEVGAAALQPVAPGDGLGTGGVDDPLHDGRGLDAVQVRHVGGAGQQAAVVAGDFQPGERLLHRPARRSRPIVRGQDLQQMLDRLVQ